MAYALIVGGEESTPLASTQGWASVKEFVDTLDVEEYGELVHFAEHGWGQNAFELISQISRAIRDESPDADVASTLEDLAESLKTAGESSYFVGDETEIES